MRSILNFTWGRVVFALISKKKFSGTLMEQENAYGIPMAPWHVELKCQYHFSPQADNLWICITHFFVVVQLLSCFWLIATPRTAALQASPFFIISLSLFKLECYSPWGFKESDMTEHLKWTVKVFLRMKLTEGHFEVHLLLFLFSPYFIEV